MNLLFVGDRVDADITSLASSGDYTFAGVDSSIAVFKRSKYVYSFTSEESFTIFQMIIVGDILMAACTDNVLRLWDVIKKTPCDSIRLPERFEMTFVMHPSTYLNKIVIASNSGQFQLWNINTMVLVHEFESNFGSPIMCVVQSPVVDVVAFGLLDGRIVIQNIKMDQTLLTFTQDSKVTCISFRTDEHHFMCSAGSNGDVSIWDLDNKRLFHVINAAHDGEIVNAEFLNGQPILLTVGADNAAKQWIFDNMDGLPRIHKARSGHSAPPTFIRFYGPDGHAILSSSRDKSLRMTSIIRDSQNTELSQGSIQKKSKLLNIKESDLKLNQIVNFSSNDAKQRQWDNILTCHSQSSTARTWNFQSKVIGKFALETLDHSVIKSVGISHCGNNAFIGSSLGSIDMYNLQSGIYKKSFNGHSKVVTGVATDNINRTLISSSLDGSVKLWDILTGKCMKTIELNSPISSFVFHTDSGLIAVLSDDLCIRVIDIDTQKIVREFAGHTNRLTDLTFSPDSRWIVSSATDCTIRTWDLPSGNCVDIFKTDSVATSLTFSATGDFLATVHVGHVGIFLWSNRSQYESFGLRCVGEKDIHYMGLPLSVTSDAEAPQEIKNVENEAQTIVDEMDTDLLTNLKSAIIFDRDAIADEMIKLSSMPKSKWQTLLHLDAIKLRNKPIAAAKAVEAAPFFLPVLSGATPKFDLEKVPVEQISKVLKMDSMDIESEFTKLLIEASTTKTHEAFFNFTLGLNPSSIDYFIRSMGGFNAMRDIRAFIEVIKLRLASKRDYEVVNVYLSVLFKIHGELIVQDESLIELVKELEEKLKESWGIIREKVDFSLCLLDFIRM